MSKPDNVTSMVRLRGKVDETQQSVTIEAPRRRRRKRGWRDHVSMVDIGLMAKLEASGLEWRVLWAMMSHVPEKGGAEAHCTMQEIADQIGVQQPSVARVIKSLKDRRIVWMVKQGKWRVNTWLMYNGDFDSWNVEAEHDPEPIWSRGVDAATGEVR